VDHTIARREMNLSFAGGSQADRGRIAGRMPADRCRARFEKTHPSWVIPFRPSATIIRGGTAERSGTGGQKCPARSRTRFPNSMRDLRLRPVDRSLGGTRLLVSPARFRAGLPAGLACAEALDEPFFRTIAWLLVFCLDFKVGLNTSSLVALADKQPVVPENFVWIDHSPARAAFARRPHPFSPSDRTPCLIRD